jgi:hypothetical protein
MAVTQSTTSLLLQFITFLTCIFIRLLLTSVLDRLQNENQNAATLLLVQAICFRSLLQILPSSLVSPMHTARLGVMSDVV